MLPLGWKENVEEFLFSQFFSLEFDGLQLFRTDHADGQLHEIPDHRLHVPPHITDFREFAGFYLEKGRLCQPRKPTCDLRLPDSGGADHDDVFGSDFIPKMFRNLLAAPAVSKGDGDHSFGIVLANDKLIQFPDDLCRSQRLLHRIKAPQK